MNHPQDMTLSDIEQLKQAALSRMHAGAPETLPGLNQIRARVFLDLAQHGIALYACPDHPLAAQDLAAVLSEVRESGWLGVYERLHALAETYPLHVLIVCAASLTGPIQMLEQPSAYTVVHWPSEWALLCTRH